MSAKKKKDALRLAHLFTDHAVLQRDRSVPVWGWTTPGLRVRVTLGPYTAETRSGDDGRFLTRLPPMPAGGPYELDVNTPDPDAHVRLTDVMVGEVWVCSGQSNMEWPVSQTDFDVQTLRAADREIRSLRVPQRTLLGHQSDVDAAWQVASPETVAGFTAVGFFFGRRLTRELGVAVGLINASWGGTRIETWISREELVLHGRTRDEVARYEASVAGAEYWGRFDPFEPDSQQARDRQLVLNYPRDPGNTGAANGWADAAHDDHAWESMIQPGSWLLAGHATNGVFWFRRDVTIPAEWAGKDLALGLGAIDKQDITYFNGEQVGSTGQYLEDQYWCVPRSYTLPGRLVKAGRAVIAVRVYSFIYDGGMIGPQQKMTLGLADMSAEPIPLAGVWRMKIEHEFGLVKPQTLPEGLGNPQSPYMLNDNMIHPLIPYAIQGATWYQGESNDNISREYGWMLRALIRDWRRAWGQGDFTFLTVQLANFHQPMAYQANSTWATVREGQMSSLQEANTGVAVAIDIGESHDIHPRNKQDVGSRLAQWALSRTYGKPLVPSGPLYRDHVIAGDRIRLRFDHTGGGLVARGGELKTFVIAGADGKFLSAVAEIEGDSVWVRAPAVPEPAAVRYAWADNPDGCNLYNREGLPASPFRTDEW
jgi:sialate O-acetylesterase